MTARSDVTRVIEELADGNPDAAAELLPLVYDELRGLADWYLRDQPCDHTLQPTALVHEAYIRLVGHQQCTWESRAQFFAVAAKAMRRLLIDHARRRCAAKRGGGRQKLSLEHVVEQAAYRDEYLVALDDALKELTSLDGQLTQVVELRFFGGLSIDQTAHVIGVSPTTVKRLWRVARGWLHREITRVN